MGLHLQEVGQMYISLQQIGQRLYSRRLQMNMTQEELAELANVTAQTISFAELGKKAMRADTIVGICQALKISADYLLFGEITNKELSVLEQKISQLSPDQYQHLEEIINNYIAAVNMRES